MTRLSLTIILLSAFVLSGCSNTDKTTNTTATNTPQPGTSGTKKIASADVVKATISPLEITAGASRNLVVHLTIQSGYHVNANPPTYPYLKATQLEIPPAEGLTIGTVSYPKALERKFDFDPKPLAVYEDEAELQVPIKANSSAAKGERSIPARLRVQACDKEVCYPPGVINLSIPLRIS